MTFCEDLSPYDDELKDTFWEGDGARVVTFAPRYKRINVGWLAAGHAYPVGSPPDGFISQLDRILRGQYVNAVLGMHPCELCPPSDWHNPTGPWGGSEIRVPGPDDQVFAAPYLVGHYVVDHGYLPPPSFIEAVLACTDTWRNGPPPPWLPDDAQRLDFEADD